MSKKSITCQDYILRTSIYLMKENGFILKKKKKTRSRRYSAKTMTDADYADYQALLTKYTRPSWIHGAEPEANTMTTWLLRECNKTKFMCFKQEGAIFTLSGKPLKSADHFIYHRSNISSTESDVSISIENEWSAIGRLSIIWKSDLSHEREQDFAKLCQYGCTTRTQMKGMEKRFDRIYTRVLRTVLDQSWEQQHTN